MEPNEIGDKKRDKTLGQSGPGKFLQLFPQPYVDGPHQNPYVTRKPHVKLRIKPITWRSWPGKKKRLVEFTLEKDRRKSAAEIYFQETLRYSV